jgi:hypothetical protein
LQTASLPLNLIAAAIVLLIPGGAFLAWAAPRRAGGPPDAVNFIADASALSLSIAALIGLAGNLLSLRFSGTAVAAFYALAGALLAGGLGWRAIRRPAGESAAGGRRLGWLVSALLGLTLLGALTAWRLYQARELAVAPWVDSVHHTLVTRIILEHGGVPSTLEPYMAVPFVYHYGFHLAAALFAFWSGAAPDQAVLWFGQLLNALVALAVYRAAAACSPYAGDTVLENAPPRWQIFIWRAFPFAAALMAGFAFQMPAYYLTWGRFTLLAGLLLLGPAIAAAMDAWDDPRRIDAWLRLTLLIAGLGLTHILALLLLAFFLALLGLAAALRILRRAGGWDFMLRLAAFSLLGLALAAPWILYTVSEGPYDVNAIITVDMDTSEAARQRAVDYWNYLVYLMGPRRSHILLAISGAGLLAVLLRPQQRSHLRARRIFLAGWALLMVIFTLPWGTRSSPFRADYFAIVLFFPAAILLAALLVECAAALGRVTRAWAGGLVLLALLGALSGWGIWETRSIINPVTVIATPADARALDWVRVNTPQDARFYINSAHWLSGIYRGIDGGYWLLPYTGRQSLIPPVFYTWASPEQVAQINDWAKRSAELTGCTPEFWQLAREAQLTHVYLRDGAGNLQPSHLAECPRLQPVYQDQGVYIYAILRP